MTLDSEPTPDEEFLHVFRPGQLYLFTGPRGAGKTTKAAHAAVRALEQEDVRYCILSNIVIKRKTERGWREDYPPHFFKIVTWAQVFKLLPDLLEDYDRILLIIDEAVLSGQGAGMSTLQAEVRAVLGLSTVLRKAHMAYVLIVLDESATMKNFREVGSIVNAIFRSKRGRPSEYEIVTEEGKTLITGFKPRGFARPKEAVPDGELVFDTASSASFTHGRLGGKPFDMMSALYAMSDCIEEETAAKLREYIESKERPPAPDPLTEVPMREVLKGHHGNGGGVSTRKNVKPGVVEALKRGTSVRDIVATFACSKQFVYETRRELRAAGQL